ncbi:diacylglycerol kinase family protein [Bacillus rubiinfantis]|uniref:diacylglycerol kinase family protein n=1 Tax=Bacillus rubiinfantis TaxID=1499680 RepID=UPI0005AA0BF3|nr:diacylglycerol kinase family protein [Bacillus rubiinfantis]
MDLHDKRIKKHPLYCSFFFAFRGIWSALLQERNMRIHGACAIIILLASFYFSIEKMEWLFIVFAIAGMFSLELINSALERVVDLVSPTYHPLAKQAKDMAAGAVLIFALITIVIGLTIFLPYVLVVFK